MTATLILASASESRRKILEAAGVAFKIAAPDVDEATLKTKLRAGKASASDTAAALAEGKALSVSARFPGSLVLGGDQVLVCEDTFYDKAVDTDDARRILRALRGRKHELITAAVLARDSSVKWRHVESAHLWMRDFTDAFLEHYITSEGAALLDTIGCYRIEERGAQLFAKFGGDYFAICGLPLFPVLKALRDSQVLTR